MRRNLSAGAEPIFHNAIIEQGQVQHIASEQRTESAIRLSSTSAFNLVTRQPQLTDRVREGEQQEFQPERQQEVASRSFVSFLPNVGLGQNLQSESGVGGEKRGKKRKESQSESDFSEEDKKKLEKLKEIGFKSNFVSSVAKRTEHHCIERILKFIDEDSIEMLTRLTKRKDSIFTNTNLSSMFNGAESKIKEGIKSLCDNEVKLKELMNSVEEGGCGFTSANISSILNGAGVNLKESIEILLENKERIRELIAIPIKDGKGFTPTNISSIISLSGFNIKKAIEDLINPETIEKIKELTKPLEEGGLTFNLGHISSILHKEGSKVKEWIQDLIDNKEKIIKIMNISGQQCILNNLSHKMKAEIKGFLLQNGASIISASKSKKPRTPSSRAVAVLQSQVEEIGMGGAGDPALRSQRTEVPSLLSDADEIALPSVINQSQNDEPATTVITREQQNQVVQSREGLQSERM